MLSTAMLSVLLLVLSLVTLGDQAQSPMPAWVSSEFQTLKSDMKAQIGKLSSTLARIDNALIRLREPPSTSPPDNLQYQRSNYPRTCREALSSKIVRHDRWTYIDPDGPMRSIKPFSVRCGWSGAAVTTEFGFSNSYWMKNIGGPRDCIDHRDFGVPGAADYCPTTKTKIDYALSLDQMRAAVHVSGNCSQRVDWDCHASSMLYLDSLGTKAMAFGMPLESFEYFSQGLCECGKDNSCVKSSSLCNCAADSPNSWLRDRIVVTDKRSLPVTAFTLGDMLSNRDQAQISVSNVVCQDNPWS
ncbi:contactin-associated protein-like 3B [Watersipora subatra]|uniref:contactin-associated protein-like 3B n=1 Tax=Watersipora subatra TaxID=2589382 RepID=UPI00355C4F9D